MSLRPARTTERPLIAPDWCHFTQRLQRSRAHKHLKAADLPYEDEKFSYVILARAACRASCARAGTALVTKIAVTAKNLYAGWNKSSDCPASRQSRVQTRQKWNWGDAIFSGNDGAPE
jgi:hypothetical protein